MYNLNNNIYINVSYSFIDKTKPTAMDVYQGRPVLEITYRGNVPIDSTVVFKKKK